MPATHIDTSTASSTKHVNVHGELNGKAAPVEPRRAQAPLAALQSAHDLANSLTGVHLLVKSIRHNLPADAEVARYFASLASAARHSSDVCERLLALLDGDRHDGEIPTERMRLSRSVLRLRKQIAAMTPPPTRLHFDLADDLPMIHANRMQITQMLLELISNAVEALPERAGDITVRTGAMADERSNGQPAGQPAVFLEVSDTGVGIEEAHLERIYEPSFTTKSNGHGLGMYGVAQIVAGCGGAVQISSRLGAGTTVRCVFPAIPREAPTSTDAAKSPVSPPGGPSPSAAEPFTILLIEDNDAARLGCKLSLENNGDAPFTVWACGSGRDAIAMLEDHMPEIDAVVLDLHLPDCDGVELLRAIRQRGGVPVIVTSGSTERAIAERLGRQSPDGILVKPFRIEQLTAMVREVVGHASQQPSASTPPRQNAQRGNRGVSVLGT